MWIGKKADIGHFRIFELTAHVHVPKVLRMRLGARASKVILGGYQKQSKNYRLYRPDTKKIAESRNVRFAEDKT